MAVRTTSDLVEGILMRDYDAAGAPSLTPFIATATVIVDRVAVCAAAKDLTLTDAELELIERWLAAHFYAQSDKPYASKSTKGAGGSFHGKTAMYLESTLYGQTASGIDRSGCLQIIVSGTRKVASAAWLGKVPSDQTDAVDRR